MQEEVLADLAELREGRNDSSVAKALDRLEQAARTDENLMPRILDGVECLATVGEICARLERVFGKYRPGGAF